MSTPALGASLLLGTLLSSACCSPDSIAVRTWRENGECVMEIDFEEAAFGVYVTSPGAKLPREQKSYQWLTYWAIDTDDFPPAIQPPVRYGVSVIQGGEDSKIAAIKSDATGAEDDPFWTRIGLPANTTAQYPLPVGSDGERLSLEDIGAFQISVVTMSGNGVLVVGAVDEQGRLVGDKPFRCGDSFGELPLHYGWE